MDKKAEKMDEKMKESNGNGGDEVVEEYESPESKIADSYGLGKTEERGDFFFFFKGKTNRISNTK